MKFIARHPSAKKNASAKRTKRLKTVAMLPSMFTLCNLLCGFAAIYFAMRATFDSGAGVGAAAELTLSSDAIERVLPSFLSVGAGLVILGLMFDMFDGLIARITHQTSEFGAQLDTLADLVTAGVAPAALMLAFMMTELRSINISLSPLSESAYGRFAWVSASVYVACAAVRLARFNVEQARTDHDHRMFRGLPSPGAAGLMASVLICIEQAHNANLYSLGRVALYALPVVALITGLLMVSRLPYRKVIPFLGGRKPYYRLVVIIFFFGAFWVAKALTLAFVASCFVLSGPITALIARLSHKNDDDSAADPALADSAEETKAG